MNKEELKIQAYSFAKTYATVFITLYLYAVEQQGHDMFEVAMIVDVAKFSLLSLVRNVYKLLTEKE